MLRSSFSILFLLLIGCNKPEISAPKFQLLRKTATGLDFDNTPKQSAALNVFNYMYFFNGGGIAAGDFNKDGQIDLFFTSNMGPDKLFINEGKLHFRDVTILAQVNGTRLNPVTAAESSLSWKTGASVVDLNNDGMLDIYISQVGDYKAIKGRNRMLICQKIENGIPVFADMATHEISPPYPSTYTSFSARFCFVRSTSAPGLSILLIATI